MIMKALKNLYFEDLKLFYYNSSFYIFHSADQRLLEESTTSLSKSFAINNCSTGNFGALIEVFLARARELKASSQVEE